MLSTLSTGWAWPTDNQWHPVPKGGTAIQDPQSDAQGSRNVVPDDAGGTPAAYTFNDGVSIHFRFRLDDDPSGTGGQGLLQSFGWGFEIDTDQNADDYEWLMMLDGISNPEVIRLMENTVKSHLGDPSDTAEDVVPPYPLAGNYRVLAADTCFDSKNNPSGVCNAQYDYQDYFLDYKIPYAVFKAETGITDSTLIRFFVGSSSAANNLTENGADLVAGSDLYAMASDYVTPFGIPPTNLTFYDGQVRFVDDLNGAFDQYVAAPGDTIFIRVGDLDLNRQTLPGGVITVTVSSPTGDSERVTLYATGVQGKYTGSLPTATNDSDGILHILTGQTATVTYTEAIDSHLNQNVADGDNIDQIYFTSTGTDLAVSKSVNDEAPVEGDTVTFSITVTNNGPASATSITISDILPAGELTYQGSRPSAGTSYNSTSGDWSIPTGLAVGASTTLEIDAYVEPGTNGMTLTNTATRSASTPADSYAANDSGTAEVRVGGTDLRVTKSVDDPLPLEGQTIVYTVRVLNLGPADTTGVEVTDSLPNGVTYVSHTTNQGTYTIDPSGPDIWTIGSLTSGAGALLRITATVDTGTLGQVIKNTASLTATGQPDTNPANDSDSAAIKVEYLDLSLAKEVRRFAPSTSPFRSSIAADVGDTVEFRITVYNNGPHDATGVEITDTVPVGLSYVAASASVSTGSFNSTTGVWALGTLNDKANATLTFQATINTGTEGQTLVNEAEITDVDQPDSSPGDEYDIASVSVDGTDLQITKAVDNQTPNNGDTITWTITVQNNGPNQATSIIVTDLLPDGLAYKTSQGKVVHTVTQGSFDSSGTWDIGTLEVIPTNPFDAVLTFATTVTGVAGDIIRNNAFITSADQADPEGANNVASEYVAVGGTDLVIAKIVNDDTPNVGQTIIYTLTVSNEGPSEATNVVVNDLLPPELNWLSDTPSQGSYDSATGLWTIGDLVYGAAPVTLAITAEVLNEDSNLVITNTAEVSATEADQDTTNNIATADIMVNATDLVLSKTVDEATPYEGANITYNVAVLNSSASQATNVEIEDILPPGVTYVSSTPSQGAYSAGLWIVGTLPGNATETLKIVAKVDTGTAGQTITNTAALDTNILDQIDTDPSNDISSVDIVPQAAPPLPLLTFVKSAQVDSDPVNGGANPKAIPGASVRYTLQAINFGTGSPNADTLVLTDPIPANTSLYVGDLGQGSPVFFTDIISSGFTAGDVNVSYSNNTDCTDYSYNPVPVDGHDANICNLRIQMNGTMNAASGGTNPNFSLHFLVRIN